MLLYSGSLSIIRREENTRIKMKVREPTLFPICGEFGLNHVSALSVWQWAKQEFINNPFFSETENSFTALTI